MLVHAFNFSTWKAEAGRSLSLRPVRSTVPISGQPSVGSEGNHGKQKAGEDIIERGGRVLVLVNNKTWQLWPYGFGFRVKDRRKEGRGYGIFLCNQGKAVKPGMCWRCPYMEPM